MPSNWLSGQDTVTAGIATLGGLIGRLMALSQERRMPLRWGLIWELPTAIGMGLVARGAADYFNVAGFPAFAISIVGGYIGPGIISWGVQKAKDKYNA